MIFIGLVCAIVLISILIHSQFLEDYYIYHKQTTLVELYDHMNEAIREGVLEEEKTLNDLSVLVENGNISLVVIANNNQKVLTATTNEVKTQELMTRLFGYIMNTSSISGIVLKEGKTYQICSVKDGSDGRDYIDMWGYLNNGSTFILRSPLESIRESALLSNEFLIYTMMIMLALGSILVWYFSKKITDPILELANLSQRMADLDFEAKYTSGGKNEIGILGASFNSMSEKLENTISQLKNANFELQRDIEKKEKMESMRTEFIGSVSHELKTPIALIQGYTEGLKEGISEDPESRAFYCDVIMDEANKMNQLVHNLLTLNKLEFGEEEVSFERFDLTEVIAGVIQSCEILIQQKEAEVRFDDSETVFVWSDEFKVEQVLRNYFSNALNHVENERVIDIRVSRIEERDTVRVSVFNTGIPIPQEDIEQIWNKFYKVDKARTREYGGHGIGLSIVKAIMDSFGNAYGVKNYDNGVEFWFELDVK